MSESYYRFEHLDQLPADFERQGNGKPLGFAVDPRGDGVIVASATHICCMQYYKQLGVWADYDDIWLTLFEEFKKDHEL